MGAIVARLKEEGKMPVASDRLMRKVRAGINIVAKLGMRWERMIWRVGYKAFH